MKKVLLLLMAVMSLCSLKAQELRMPKYGFLDNWSVSVLGGTNVTWGDDSKIADVKNLFAPTVNIGLNKWITPTTGVRLVGDWNQSHVVSYIDTKGKAFIDNPNHAGVYVDFMVNPFSMLSMNGYDSWFKPVIFAGIGYAHTFKNDYYPVGDYVVPRIGLQLNFDITDAIQLNVEGNGCLLNDKFDNVVGTARYDGKVNLLAGLTYKFSHNGSRGFQYIPSYDQEDIDALNDEINQLRTELDKKPKEVQVIKEVSVEKVVKVKELIPMTVRFEINSDKIEDKQMANLQNIADYMKDNPEVKLSITGYADVQTGSSEYNLKLSEKRAETVKNSLVKLGIKESKLEVGFEGDKVQQYEQNDWNRCSIIINE